MSSNISFPAAVTAEEIDLVSIIQVLFSQKKLIALVTGVIGGLAIAYAILATPEYQVSSVLRPAAINELDALNRSEIYHLPPIDALQKVGLSLDSYETRLGFFRANKELFKDFERPGRTLEQSFEEFNRNSISLTLPDLKKTDPLGAFIKLELAYPQGIDGVSILNGLVAYAMSVQRDEIAADLKGIINNRLGELKGKIDAARSNYEIDKETKIATLYEADNIKRAKLQDELKALRQQLVTMRGDRIAQLSEAISIARSLGIKKPSTPSSLAESANSLSGSVIRTEVNNQQIPLYFMGVDALEAERAALMQRKSDDFSESRIAEIAKELQLLKENRQIEVLKQRKNEDIFLANVQSLRDEEVRLRNLNIEISRLKLATIDKLALQPLNPIKPKRELIVVLGLVFGLILGVVAALVRGLIFRRLRQVGNRPVLVSPVLDVESDMRDVRGLQSDK